ncbi:hypothetical protein QUF64_00595 [Anaerolineales bacterium HSG6]|nr:hypothetical protein [Anaerolineales bacterium HSG6]
MTTKHIALLRPLIIAIIASLLMIIGLAELTFAMPSQPQHDATQLQIITGTKTAMPTNDVLAGEVITYTIVFSSNTTISNLVITDAVPEFTTYQPDSVGCTPIISFSLCIIQLDNRTLQWQPKEISSIPVTLTFAVKVDDPITSGLTITNLIKIKDTTLQQINTVASQPALQVTIQTDKRQAAIDEQIQYTYIVTNIGNELLTDITLTDTRFDTVSLPTTTLIAGQVISTVVTYTMQVSDHPGSVINSIQGHAVSEMSGTNINSNIDNVGVAIDNRPSIAVLVIATPTLAYVGETITYHYFITNTGNITLVNVIVTDDRLGSVEVASIDPQEVVAQTETYVAQSADLPTTILNQVTARGEGLLGGSYSAESGAQVQITGTAVILMAVVPSQSTAEVNDPLTYTYYITNMGYITLTEITLSDIEGDVISLPTTILAPQASLVVSEPYTVQATDLSNSLTKNVTATATSIVGSTTISAQATVFVVAHSEIRLSVIADPTTASFNDKIQYSYTITNAGEVTLGELIITDSRLGQIALPDKELVPGDSMTGRTDYQVGLTDFPSPMLNHVTATATTEASLLTDYATVTVTLQSNPELGLIVVPNKDKANVGDTIDYYYEISNKGDVPLADLSLTDNRLGTITLPLETLSPQKSVSVTRNYTTQSADVGMLTNVATTTGLFLEKPSVVTEKVSLKVISVRYIPVIMKNVVSPQPELLLEVWPDKDEASLYETVSFTYMLTNIGNVPIHNLALEDGLGNVDIEKTILEPGDFIETDTQYQIWKDDLFELVNEVTATAIYKERRERLHLDTRQLPPTNTPKTVIRLTEEVEVSVKIPTAELYIQSIKTGDMFLTLTKIPEGWVYSCLIKNNQTEYCVDLHPGNYRIETETTCGRLSEERTFFERDDTNPFEISC